ncbi:Pathogenesis-related thaumatin superfamily protein [Euphorbia peplus]|nr:Pathogenesis-related thaumatin superfamily protein [Euphorbia peplus]
MKLCRSACFFHFFFFINFFSSGSLAHEVTLHIRNKCSFPIWPATAPNTGHPVIAEGGFYLPSGQTQHIVAPWDWSGRIWARTCCNFNHSATSNWQPACETGDCDGRLACNGLIGKPPVTLIELALQPNKPNFYDVSLVDGYNLPVSVTDKQMSPKCSIRGCEKSLIHSCPPELQVVDKDGEVVACKSACLAFNLDSFCCRNEYGSPGKCKASVYSKMFKQACPAYFSYAFDSPSPLISCAGKEYFITFCPSSWAASM